MRRTLQWIVDVTGGVLRGDPDVEIENFETDTRSVFGENAIFVALSGENFDGHAFVSHAESKGAVAVLAERDLETSLPYVVVDNALLALQALAQDWRSKRRTEVIGVTGSNGKTIVKDMLAGILSRVGTTFRSPGSYNSQLGVALSLLAIRDEHRYAVIEAGISEVGEMDRLRAMIRPDAMIWTNVGDAHSRGLGGPSGITREKAKLADGISGPVVFPASDDRIDDAIGDLANAKPIHVENVKRIGNGYTFDISLADKSEALSVFAVGEHNATNAALAASMASVLGVETNDIRIALAAYEPVDLRLQIHTTQRGVTLINDSYNSDPTSVRAALAALKHFGSGHRKIVVLGDMLDLGSIAEQEHERLGAAVAGDPVEKLIVVGDFSQFIATGARNAGMPEDKIFIANDVNHAGGAVREFAVPGDYVLVKGSRALQLDRVAAQFLDSVGPARLTVDLNALAQNVSEIRRALGDAKLMAVVKSFAYGNDATRISQALVQQGVDAFVVAYPDEAIPLRRRGIDVPVLVTNVFAEEVDKIARYDLHALVSRIDLIDRIANSPTRNGKTVGVHLEIETGMNRLGIRPGDALEAARQVVASDGLALKGVMTHFAAADDPQEDDFTRSQLTAFQSVLDQLGAAGIDPGMVHAANTAAAWRFPESRFDAVRIGLGIYGLHPSASVGGIATTEPVLKFTTKVIDVRHVEEGETVGYGRTWRADGRKTIATIAVGYNDGFRRFMSNGGEVLINGARCRVSGNVCMDATMVDVSHLDDVNVGDEVVLFGAQGSDVIGVDELAHRGDTISYEILTGISPRVRRIFERS